MGLQYTCSVCSLQYGGKPGWSPAGGMIPACMRPLWDSMWWAPPSVTLCSLLGGRPGLELWAKKKKKHKSLPLVIRLFNPGLPGSPVGPSRWDGDGWPGGLRETVLLSVKLAKYQRGKKTNWFREGAAVLQICCPPVNTSKQKKEFPYGINKTPHYCSAYSFICLLIKCVPSPPPLLSPHHPPSNLSSRRARPLPFSPPPCRYLSIKAEGDQERTHRVGLGQACSINPEENGVRHHFGSD